MEKKSTKVYKYLLAALGFASLASCDKIKGIIPGSQVCEYGMPTMEYKVSGKVVDQASAPIRGIVVKAQESHTYPDSVLTDENGKFTLEGESFPQSSFGIVLKDIDGTANGGEFRDTTVQAELTKTKKGSGNWNQGTFEAKDITIKLEKK